MAVTHGHGNPPWTRDETILALDMYFATKGKNVGPNDAEAIALSNLLRSMPYHEKAARKTTFRNPDGVAFKIQNLKSVETGKGLKNVSTMDRAIWEEFGGRPAEVRRLALLIRAGIEAHSEDDTDEDEQFVGGEEFYEGRLLTRSHQLRERHPGLRRKLLEARGAEGLVCEVCGESHSSLDPVVRLAAFEAHHNVPIATAGVRKTKISDMALLCATCHRLLHRLIAVRKEWVSVERARQLLGYD